MADKDALELRDLLANKTLLEMTLDERGKVCRAAILWVHDHIELLRAEEAKKVQRVVPCPLCGCGSANMPCAPVSARAAIIEECAKAAWNAMTHGTVNYKVMAAIRSLASTTKREGK